MTAETGGFGGFVVCQTGSCSRKAMVVSGTETQLHHVIRVTSSQTPRVVERGGGGREDHL